MRIDGPVVIALARTSHSPDTLSWGLAEAKRMGREVRLVAVVDTPREVAMWSWAVVTPDVSEGAAAEGYLVDVIRRVRANERSIRISPAVREGSPAGALLAESHEAALLVVGAGGRGRRTVSRVAAHVATQARCPVAVVRPAAAVGADGRPAPVVVGVDGSAASFGAAHVAAGDARGRGARLRLVHALRTVAAPYGDGGTVTQTVDDGPAREAAAELAQQLRERHVGLEVEELIVEDDPAHALVAASQDAQVLVVGSRGLGAFPGMLMGSVSQEVVRDASCTVLVTHDVEVPPAVV